MRLPNKFSRANAAGYNPLQKFTVVAEGFRFAVENDRSVTRKIVISSLVILASLYFRRWLDLLLIIVVTGQALAAELFNTAIETLCDYVQPGPDEKIKAVKDVASAATGVSTLVWALVLIYEYFEILLKFWR